MRWWIRLQMAWGSAGQIINISLLSLSAATPVARYLGCRALWPALVLPPLIVAGLLVLGWALDRWGWMQRLDALGRARSGTWQECLERLARIEAAMGGVAVERRRRRR